MKTHPGLVLLLLTLTHAPSTALHLSVIDQLNGRVDNHAHDQTGQSGQAVTSHGRYNIEQSSPNGANTPTIPSTPTVQVEIGSTFEYDYKYYDTDYGEVNDVYSEEYSDETIRVRRDTAPEDLTLEQRIAFWLKQQKANENARPKLESVKSEGLSSDRKPGVAKDTEKVHKDLQNISGRIANARNKKNKDKVGKTKTTDDKVIIAEYENDVVDGFFWNQENIDSRIPMKDKWVPEKPFLDTSDVPKYNLLDEILKAERANDSGIVQNKEADQSQFVDFDKIDKFDQTLSSFHETELHDSKGKAGLQYDTYDQGSYLQDGLFVNDEERRKGKQNSDENIFDYHSRSFHTLENIVEDTPEFPEKGLSKVKPSGKSVYGQEFDHAISASASAFKARVDVAEESSENMIQESNTFLENSPVGDRKSDGKTSVLSNTNIKDTPTETHPTQQPNKDRRILMDKDITTKDNTQQTRRDRDDERDFAESSPIVKLSEAVKRDTTKAKAEQESFVTGAKTPNSEPKNDTKPNTNITLTNDVPKDEPLESIPVETKRVYETLPTEVDVVTKDSKGNNDTVENDTLMAEITNDTRTTSAASEKSARSVEMGKLKHVKGEQKWVNGTDVSGSNVSKTNDLNKSEVELASQIPTNKVPEQLQNLPETDKERQNFTATNNNRTTVSHLVLIDVFSNITRMEHEIIDIVKDSLEADRRQNRSGQRQNSSGSDRKGDGLVRTILSKSGDDNETGKVKDIDSKLTTAGINKKQSASGKANGQIQVGNDTENNADKGVLDSYAGKSNVGPGHGADQEELRKGAAPIQQGANIQGVSNTNANDSLTSSSVHANNQETLNTTTDNTVFSQSTVEKLGNIDNASPFPQALPHGINEHLDNISTAQNGSDRSNPNSVAQHSTLLDRSEAIPVAYKAQVSKVEVSGSVNVTDTSYNSSKVLLPLDNILPSSTNPNDVKKIIPISNSNVTVLDSGKNSSTTDNSSLNTSVSSENVRTGNQVTTQDLKHEDKTRTLQKRTNVTLFEQNLDSKQNTTHTTADYQPTPHNSPEPVLKSNLNENETSSKISKDREITSRNIDSPISKDSVSHPLKNNSVDEKDNNLRDTKLAYTNKNTNSTLDDDNVYSNNSDVMVGNMNRGDLPKSVVDHNSTNSNSTYDTIPEKLNEDPTQASSYKTESKTSRKLFSINESETAGDNSTMAAPLQLGNWASNVSLDNISSVENTTVMNNMSTVENTTVMYNVSTVENTTVMSKKSSIENTTDTNVTSTTMKDSSPQFNVTDHPENAMTPTPNVTGTPQKGSSGDVVKQPETSTKSRTTQSTPDVSFQKVAINNVAAGSQHQTPPQANKTATSSPVVKENITNDGNNSGAVNEKPKDERPSTTDGHTDSVSSGTVDVAKGENADKPNGEQSNQNNFTQNADVEVSTSNIIINSDNNSNVIDNSNVTVNDERKKTSNVTNRPVDVSKRAPTKKKADNKNNDEKKNAKDSSDNLIVNSKSHTKNGDSQTTHKSKDDNNDDKNVPVMDQENGPTNDDRNSNTSNNNNDNKNSTFVFTSDILQGQQVEKGNSNTSSDSTNIPDTRAQRERQSRQNQAGENSNNQKNTDHKGDKKPNKDFNPENRQKSPENKEKSSGSKGPDAHKTMITEKPAAKTTPSRKKEEKKAKNEPKNASNSNNVLRTVGGLPYFGSAEAPMTIPETSAYRIQDFSLSVPKEARKKKDTSNAKTNAKGNNNKNNNNNNNNNTNSEDKNSSGGSGGPCNEACSPELSLPAPRPQAAVSAVLTTHFGPTKDKMIPFDLELLDLADNYDNTTGMFICTIPGTYVISLYLMSHPGAKVNARVFINNRPIAALWADDAKNAGFYPSSSTQTIAQLGFGDQVYVMLVDGGYGDSWVHANYNVFTVFLLYEQIF